MPELEHISQLPWNIDEFKSAYPATWKRTFRFGPPLAKFDSVIVALLRGGNWVRLRVDAGDPQHIPMTMPSPMPKFKAEDFLSMCQHFMSGLTEPQQQPVQPTIHWTPRRHAIADTRDSASPGASTLTPPDIEAGVSSGALTPAREPTTAPAPTPLAPHPPSPPPLPPANQPECRSQSVADATSAALEFFGRSREAGQEANTNAFKAGG